MKGVFVSGDAVVGDNCIIFQQVTIGSVMLPDGGRRGAPVIGDNVYIGAGAKIVGAVRVGNNVRIGANTVVHEDVPDNCVVVSGRQRVIPREEALDNRFYCLRDRWVYFERGRYLGVEDPETIRALDEAREWARR